jgi:chemotaxis protein CheX
MQIEEADICRLTETVWSTVVGLEVHQIEPESKTKPGDGFVTGCVSIVGDWEGAVAVHCSLRLARQVATVMFGSDDPQADEVRDALGELTNITGGNIKSLLPGPCELSLPSVIEGRDYHLSMPGSRLLNRVFMECENEPLQVLVLQRDENAATDLRLATATAASL